MKLSVAVILAGMVSVGAEVCRQRSCSCLAEQAANGAITVKEMRCEYAQNPLGIDTPSPRFSWILESNLRGQMQSAYRILVASSKQKLKPGAADKWDSGKISSDKSVNVPYKGTALSSGEKCYWKVRVWDKNGKALPWSAPAAFEMGLLKESDWQGKWIAMDGIGIPLSYVKGKFGRALNLDGKGQSVEIPHYSKSKPAEQITISAWIKPRWIGSQWQHIYRKEDGNARHVFAIGDYPDDISGLWLGLGIAGSYVERGAAVDTAVLTDGKWHLATATYDGSYIRFYFDGAEIGSYKQTGKLDTSGSNPGCIGAMSGGMENFEGDIDDVRIYSRALSANEIKSTAAGAGIESNLVGWWKLDGNLTNSADGRNGEEQTVRAAAVSPLLRREFQITKKVKRARAYISGLGWYELYINGKKVGDHVLDPGATDYDKRILYVTYDVTDLLKSRANAVGVMLGNGWFCEPRVWRYGTAPRLLMQMNVKFSDGSIESFVTDGTWKCSTGPITSNDIWGGETYDARLEKRGWTKAGFDDSDWRGVKIEESPGGKMVSQLMPPIKVTQTIKPVKSTNPKPGVYVYDMGQLFGGWARLQAKGPKGTKITIKYSGRIFKETGLIDKRCYPTPLETDYYILKGDPQGETYEPRFTFHPMRYVQIEVNPDEAIVNNLEGRVVHSSVDMSGRFHCSNPLINQIYHNTFWTVKNVLYGMPLDCLHREHYAWLEPAETPSNAYSRIYMPLLWTKFLNDMKHAQFENGGVPHVVPNYVARFPGDPAWAGNYPIVLWYLYQHYGDERILQEHYLPMKRWTDYLTGIAENHLINKGVWGDHMLPGPAPGREEFVSSETPRPLCWTGHYYRDVLIIAQAAKILGKADDTEHYTGLAENIKTAFNNKWLNKETSQYATGSQTSNIFALALDIVPQANKEGVVKNIVKNIREKHNGHLYTGIIGTTSMMEVLTEYGQGEVMYELVTKTTYPGWGYMVAQGATTIWEYWGGPEPHPNSKRQDSMAMFATISEFFYADLAGIKGPDYYGSDYMAPGFRQIEIKPYVLGDLTYANASIKTVRGMLTSSWKKTGDSLIFEVVIPVNSEAKVSIPKIGLKNVTITESGQTVYKAGKFIKGVPGITAGTETDDYVTFDTGSGFYYFKLTGTVPGNLF